jgi:oxalyl-CoA decarboxylase
MTDGIQQVADTVKLTDGFHLVVDAMKLNGLDTIYGVAGIPVTDLMRLAQAEGIRYVGFRHEQSAGNAAAIAGFLTHKPGVCMTVSAPGFLNGLVALANATTNCFPMILISGSSDRNIVDLEQGDYEELDQMNAAKRYAKAAYRARDPRRRVRASGRRLPRPDGRSTGGSHRCRSRQEVADQGRRSGAAHDPGA